MLRRSHWFQALALLCFAGPALAESAKWQEAHRTQDDVRITVARDGTASVDEQIRYRVVAGRLRSFDVKGIDADAVLTPEVEVTSEDGSRFLAHAEFAVEAKSDTKKSDKTDPAAPVVRVTVDEIQGARDKGLPRGIYAFALNYKVDLVGSHRLERDGSMWRLTWTSLPAPDGRDGVRALIDVPPSPTEPRPDAVREGTDTTIASVKRTAEKDEVELVRAHVPRDEAVQWRVRLDPKALPGVTAKELQIPAPPPPPPPKRLPHVVLGLCVILSGFLSYMLATWKMRAVSRLAREGGNAPRPLLPLPMKEVMFSLLFTAGILTASLSLPIVGAALLLLAGASMTFMPRPARARVWGPGTWLSMKDTEAFSLPTGTHDSWDASTFRGAAFAFALFGLSIALGVGLGTYVPVLRLVLPISWLALAPLFLTGTPGQVAPSKATVASFLRPVFSHLRREPTLRVSPWARIPEGKKSFEELRLLVLPRNAMPGVLGIEVACGVSASAVGYTFVPEVWLRINEGSFAAARVEGTIRADENVPGRRPEERALRVLPSFPSARGTSDLVRELSALLADRRTPVSKTRTPARRNASFQGPERRRARPASRGGHVSPEPHVSP